MLKALDLRRSWEVEILLSLMMKAQEEDERADKS